MLYFRYSKGKENRKMLALEILNVIIRIAEFGILGGLLYIMAIEIDKIFHK